MRPGDLARGLPLFGYHFLIITFYMMGRVARDAIFLAHYRAVDLPYADIAAAVLAGAIVAVYIRAARVKSVRALQEISLGCVAVSLPMFWWGVHTEQWGWLAPILYVWVGICGTLTVTQVWTLANFVWHTREAKRLFGMLGSGGIAGGIAGGFLAQWVARRLGTDAMLLVMSATLVPCFFLIPMIWRQRAVAANSSQPAEALAGERETGGLLASARLAWNSPHLRAIAVLICLASMTTTVVSWQLKAIAKDTLLTKDAMAAFLGAFTGYTGIASLVVQVLITTKLLRRYGVGVALLVLPVFLTAGSAAVAIFGTLWAATALKASDSVLRYSVDSSAVQLLYLPVPAGMKVRMKSFIDTVVWKFGDGLAGLTLLLFATSLGLTPREMTGVTFVLLAGWMAAAVVARRQYVATLHNNIQPLRIRADEAAPVAIPSLTSADPTEVLYALALCDEGQRLQSHGAVRPLLTHSSAHIRRKAIAVLSGAQDTSVRDAVVAMLGDHDAEVRAGALRYLTRHEHTDSLAHIDDLSKFGDTAIRATVVARLSRPGAGQHIDVARLILDLMVGKGGDGGLSDRLEAASLIGSLPDEFGDQLAALMQDEDSEVRREAIRAAGTLRRKEFAPVLVGHLSHPSLGAEAAATLALFGDDVAETLRASLDNRDVSAGSRHRIPFVLFRIGTPAAAVALAESLLEADLVLRSKVISALNKLHDVRRDLIVDRPLIESSMIAELMGHYRSYQILGTLGGVPDEDLQTSMAGEMERIFRLLKLLFPSIDLQNAYLGVQSCDPLTHANALEFLDNTLNPRLRGLLVPLVDSDISVAERIRHADRFLGFTADSGQ